ncbi:MAG: hypothetical protein ACKOW9_06355 [Candidatus Paceibacterota bacterium]
MPHTLKEQFEEYIIKLPREAQEAVRTSDWEKVASDIAASHDFDQEQTLDFTIMIGLILVNVSPVENLPQKIENTFFVSKQTSEIIADEILNKIIVPTVTSVSDKIAASMESKNLDWGQNLNFILSGGDYLTALEKTQLKIPEAGNQKNNAVNYLKDALKQ